MKAVILAGGYGTRIREVSESVPKPMIEIGGKPIIWHIMKNLSKQGVTEFVICLGYRGSVIKSFFLDYAKNSNDIEIHTKNPDSFRITKQHSGEDWKVQLIETGLDTPTGGRIFKARDYLKEERFLCTYGDGLADLDLNALISEHATKGKIATVTAVSPPSRFGVLEIDNQGGVKKFSEKDKVKEWVNGGFFILESEIFTFLDEDSVFEREPLEQLAIQGNLQAYVHNGFWKPMDTYREYIELNSLWDKNLAPWKNW
jgi:glucose-1-phosphate cytidylyltransferase